MYITAKCSNSSDGEKSTSCTDSDCGNTSHTAAPLPSEPRLEPSVLPKRLETTANEQSVASPEAQEVWEAPPSENQPVGGAYLAARQSSTIDWSRDGRRKKLLLKAAGDLKQTCITQYYKRY